MKSAETQLESCVVVIGVGLIGGSIAAAIRTASPGCRVIGVGRCRKRLSQARSEGLIDEFTDDIDSLPKLQRAMVVVCLPVAMIADCVCQFSQRDDDDVVITDAGSVKQIICEGVRSSPRAMARFAGAHPIAGGEKTGFEAASATLFKDRCCIVIDDDAVPHNVHRVASFWQSIGCRVTTMSAAEHDRIVALTSHLPHLAAAVATLAQTDETLPYVGPGFRDTTRVAAGDAELWTQILLGNREQVLNSLLTMRGTISQLIEALEGRNGDQLRALLGEAAERRRRIDIT